MATLTWNVVQMDAYPEKDGKQDVVFTVHWNLTGVDGDYNGYVYGTVGVTLDHEAQYTPYAELTQDQVIGWVKSALGDEQVAQYESNVQAQIEQQKNPTVVTPPLPWSN